MEGKVIRKRISICLAAVLIIQAFFMEYSGLFTLNVSAGIASATPQGVYYSFEKDSEYEISTSGGSKVASNGTLGSIELVGDFKDITSGSGKPSYDVKEGFISVKYNFDKSVLNRANTDWHLIDDTKKKVDNITLADKIKKGVIIVQSSMNGTKWVTDTVMCNAFTENTDFNKPIYETKDLQQINGCYFRVIIAYEMEKTNSTTTYVGFINVDDKWQKKYAEVYEFYVVNSKEQGNSDPSASPKMNLGSKINTGKENGFSGDEGINNKDPHLGWDIGNFYINGYTKDMKDPDDPKNIIILKNLGDKVTLWFDLTQDIDKLNSDPKLSINEDTNGYDKAFDVSQTNFKRGTMLIRFLDRERKPQKTIVYTDFLSACATTSADTRAILFEEGDYEVALDYEIKKHDVIDTYTNYKIAFRFSIRNSNCMAYPFDVVTGAELTDKAITPNGFRLDLAKSKYLDLQVQRTVLQNGAGGRSEDVRFNRAAKDGEEYKDEGIYRITVKNLYTKSETVKTIYVGTDEFLKAMSATGLSIKEIEAKLNSGATIDSNGKIADPTPTPTPAPELTLEEEDTTLLEVEDDSVTSEAPEATATPIPTLEEVDDVGSVEKEQRDASKKNDNSTTDVSKGEVTKKKGSPIGLFVFFGIICAGGVVWFVNKKKVVISSAIEKDKLDIYDKTEEKKDDYDSLGEGKKEEQTKVYEEGIEDNSEDIPEHVNKTEIDTDEKNKED